MSGKNGAPQPGPADAQEVDRKDNKGSTRLTNASQGSTAHEKAEILRRLLVGDLRRIFRHRYGPVLPDDDAGRDDLRLLLEMISLSPKAADKKMKCQVEVLAPWMPDVEAEGLIAEILSLFFYERRSSADDIGARLRLTNAERERLRAWRIAPVDFTVEDLAEQRKAKARARKIKARRRAGAASRADYLAKANSKLKPWEAKGISRATWYRNRETSPSPAIVTMQGTHLSQPTEHNHANARAVRSRRRGQGDYHGHAISQKNDMAIANHTASTRDGPVSASRRTGRNADGDGKNSLVNSDRRSAAVDEKAPIDSGDYHRLFGRQF